MSLKIYLAGPEVFLPDARDVLRRKADLVREAGFHPVTPLDKEIEFQPQKRATGILISKGNESLMHQCDAVIANLTPFRGIAADTGTVYELGFMCALEKQVFAYSNVKPEHYERIVSYYDGKIAKGADGQVRGPDGLALEDFDMVENLMLDGGIETRGGAFVTGDASADALYTDLSAFAACLQKVVEANKKGA